MPEDPAGLMAVGETQPSADAVERAAASRSWIGAAWALLTVSSAVYFLADNEADNDLWMHLFSGARVLARRAVPRIDDASYTAVGCPWIDHEWLAQVGMAGLFQGLGSPGLWCAKLLIGLLTAWLVWLLVRRVARSPWVRGPAMVLVLAAMARGYAVRPQVITYLGVAGLLVWLERVGRERIGPLTYCCLASAFILWANAHGGVMAGLAMLALYVPFGGAAAPRCSVRLGFLLVAAAATALNPYGPSLFGYVAAELIVPHPLSEWQPIAVLDAAHRPAVVLLAALALTLPFARLLRRRPWWGIALGALALMAVRSQRHVPLFALCAAAPLADQLDAGLAWAQRRARVTLSLAAQTALALGLCAVAIIQIALLAPRLWRARGGLVFVADEYPVGAFRHLRDADVRGNLALPLNWGGYALYHGAPRLRVSLDGRFATVYPPAVIEDGFAFFRGYGEARNARLLDAYPTTLALVPRGVATPLDGRPQWRVLYADDVATLYGRDGPPATGFSEAPRGWRPFP